MLLPCEPSWWECNSWKIWFCLIIALLFGAFNWIMLSIGVPMFPLALISFGFFMFVGFIMLITIDFDGKWYAFSFLWPIILWSRKAADWSVGYKGDHK